MLLNIPGKSIALVEFCTVSFNSCNPKVVATASMVLFNHLLCYQSPDRSNIESALNTAIESISHRLRDEDIANEKDTLVAMILCECRILYREVNACIWVQDKFM